MNRTWRAVLLVAVIGFAAVTGLAMFLGFEAAPSLIAGMVAALVGGGLLAAAARRADTFHDHDRSPGA